jgi:hypothetical protein
MRILSLALQFLRRVHHEAQDDDDQSGDRAGEAQVQELPEEQGNYTLRYGLNAVCPASTCKVVGNA